MRGSQVSDTGDLSPCPRIQAAAVSKVGDLARSKAGLRDAGLSGVKELPLLSLLLGTCTLGMQVQRWVYLW